jgi:hypothetical protein|tara:strand:+ start:729 stop:1256 length:528 start_codon:yes stop_codon:yes gene_type:complete
MYLLKISKQGNIIEDDGIYGIPEFKSVMETSGLGNKGLMYVSYIADYDSPYRHYNESERMRVVAKDLFGNYDWKGTKNKKIADAIAKYKELEYDPLDAQLSAFNEKIDEYTTLLDSVKINIENAADIQKVMIGVEKILITRQKLLDSIERRGERSKIAGNRELSYLETLQSQKNV